MKYVVKHGNEIVGVFKSYKYASEVVKNACSYVKLIIVEREVK